jgi:hypothetical protein
MTREEVEGKFESLTARLLEKAQAREILDYVWDIERHQVAPLLGLCELG